LFDHRTSGIGKKRKADVAEHPKVVHRVGLLNNEPPGFAEMPSI
jgi:hypothetical protein